MRQAKWDDFYYGAKFIFKEVEYKVTGLHDVFVWGTGTKDKNQKCFIRRARPGVMVKDED